VGREGRKQASKVLVSLKLLLKIVFNNGKYFCR
jgi:hypothetical protein